MGLHALVSLMPAVLEENDYSSKIEKSERNFPALCSVLSKTRTKKPSRLGSLKEDADRATA